MSANEPCADCIVAACCEALHVCLQADLLACTSCLDCQLDPAACWACDPAAGDNQTLIDCVSQRCGGVC
jgi:hypothetical protein